MNLKEAQRHGQAVLQSAGIESYRIDASLLLEKVTGKPRSWAFAHPESQLKDDQARSYVDLVNQRAMRIPLVHLTNSREFYGLDFYIDDRVLTPRVETEKMVELAIKYAPRNSSVVDIGTGSGAIAVAIKKHRPDLMVLATEVSAGALEVAKRNAKTHEADISLLKSDLLGAVEGEFETVVTNLPYLRNDADLMPEVKKEPGVALFGGTDGLELYRRFLQQLPYHLKLGGYLFTECDPWQQSDLISEAKKVGLKPIEQDYFILGFQQS